MKLLYYSYNNLIILHFVAIIIIGARYFGAPQATKKNQGEERMSKAHTDKMTKMTTEPIEKLICTMAIPTIISMLVTTFYNMADTYFVGKINNSATGAVGVVFSFMAILQAFGFFFGHGSGNYISKKLGMGDKQAAQKMAATSFFTSFAVGILISIISFIFLDPITRALGATDTILPYAKSYLKIILLGAPFITSSFVLNNQLRFQGNAMCAMVGIAVGAVINIVLDPILIFNCSMGISGAALATVISQVISFLLLIIATEFSDGIKIRLYHFTPTFENYCEIFRLGFPSLGRQGLASIAAICLNSVAGGYGDATVAAMSVVSKITMFAASTLIGFGQGFQPVCGFNYGAQKYQRVKKSFWFSIKASTAFLFVVSVIGFITAPQLIALFRDDEQVILLGTKILRSQLLSMPFHSWIVISNMMQQNIGKVWRASFLSVARQGIFFIPIVLIVPRIFGLNGLLYSQAIADVCTILCAIPIQATILSEIEKKINNLS